MRDAFFRISLATLLAASLLLATLEVRGHGSLLSAGLALVLVGLTCALRPVQALQALVALVLASSCFLLLAVGIGPRSGLYRTVTVLSGSMTPTFYPGDVLILTREPISAIHVGQVITYQIPVNGRPVESHRVVVVSRSSDGRVVVQTKGDANAVADGWKAQLEGDYVWQARAVVPWVGWGLVALRRPALSKALIYGLPSLLALWGLWQVWRPQEDEEEEVDGLAAPA